MATATEIHTLDLSQLVDEPSEPAPQPRHLWTREWVVLPLTFLVSCSVVLARAPNTILHPTLWAEDGLVWFHDAYGQGWWAPLGFTQNGYFQTLPRLVADLGLLIPLADVPFLFMLTALVVQVLPAVLVASRRFEAVIPDLRIRLLLAAVYLAIPNSNEVNANLTNAQWHLALLAVMVILAAPPRGVWRLFDLVVIAASVASGPFVFSLLVVATLLFIRRRQTWTLVLGMTAAAGAALQLFGLTTSTNREFGPLGPTATRFTEIVGGRLVGNSMLGTSITTSSAFIGHLLVFSSMFLTIAVVVVGYASWKGPLELKLFNLFCVLELAGALLSPAATIQGSQWQAMIGDAGSRYWFLPSLALLVDLVWLACQTPVRRWAGGTAIVVLAAVAVFGVRGDFRYPVKPVPNWADQVRQFDRLAPGRPYTFTYPPGYTMTLVKK